MDSAASMNRRTALGRAGALAAAFSALEAVGPFSFASVRVGASFIPPDIQFDILIFLAVPPQNYGTRRAIPGASGAHRFSGFGAGTEADVGPTDVSPAPRRTPSVPDAIVGLDRLRQDAAAPEVR